MTDKFSSDSDTWEQEKLLHSMKSYLHNIKQYNHQYKAISYLPEDIEPMYLEFLQKELNNTKLRGLPVLVKDSIYTKGMPTSAGSKRYRDFIPNHDAVIVEKIRENGGFIMGKTNTPKETLDVQTFNDLYGTTGNPFDKDFTAGGSSGGSAVALALSMCDLALGSDLAGSLRIPASFCGIYSYKPIPGSISNKGHIPPEPEHQQADINLTVGPMANSLVGLKLLTETVLGINIKSNKHSKEYKLLVSPSINQLNTDARIIEHLEYIAPIISASDINIQIQSPSLDMMDIQQCHNLFSEYQLGSRKISWSGEEMIKHKRDRIKSIIDDIMGDNDVWLLPVVATQPFPHNYDHKQIKINGIPTNYWKAMLSYVIPFSVSGHPVITLPVGKIGKFPVGVQLAGKYDKIDLLFDMAMCIENILRDST